ncbi:MAG: methyltransferase [Planctomycetota bacterium]|nr:methyltransferase [Planctomycetota bacterium]
MRLIFECQVRHLIALALLLAGVAWASEIDGFTSGALLGLSTEAWVWISVANAVAHQVFVWFCWRTELHGGLLTRYMGTAAFPIYAVFFTLLIAARPVTMTALACSNRNTLATDSTLMGILAVICALPGVYLIYSIKRYFRFRRALGIDHFDPSYRSAPLVRRGIFRFSGNAMYVYGFLLLWVPGLAFRSVAALGVAFFGHIYIWVHYAFTEKPDMNRIYGTAAGRPGDGARAACEGSR